VTLFLDRRFSAACASVTIAFFALFGFIFLITQFFQFLRDYSALGTGVRILPVAASIAVASIAGGQLAPRLGTKAVVGTGMLMLGSSFIGVSMIGVDVDYVTTVVPLMVLMGLGLGLITTPATESIMQVLPPARAGVGSAVNDATRELGGTLGVAVVGSLSSPRCTARASSSSSRDASTRRRSRRRRTRSATPTPSPRRSRESRAPWKVAFMDGLSQGSLVVGLCASSARPWPGGPCLPTGTTRSPRVSSSGSAEPPRPRGGPRGQGSGSGSTSPMAHAVSSTTASPSQPHTTCRYSWLCW
jgi:hypothetical protein